MLLGAVPRNSKRGAGVTSYFGKMLSRKRHTAKIGGLKPPVPHSCRPWLCAHLNFYLKKTLPYGDASCHESPKSPSKQGGFRQPTSQSKLQICNISNQSHKSVASEK